MLFLSACAAACSPPSQPSPPQAPVVPAFPPDAVLLVDGLPLTAAEVEPLARDIAALYPEYSTLHQRRLALTNEFLPRLAVRASDPQAWEAARTACAAADPTAASEVRQESGRFRALGVSLWSAARHLPPGEWSAPLELSGRWLRLRLEAREVRDDPREEELRLSLLEFPLLDPASAQAAIEGALDRANLTLLDPAWAEAVPEAWKHRMHASYP